MSGQKIVDGLLRTHHCGELRSSDAGKTVSLCGWINKERNLGGLHFIDVRDKYGITQLNFEQFPSTDANKEILAKCNLEAVIKAKGLVRKRPDAAINKDMETGEVEIVVQELEVLSGCDIERIPFLPFGAVPATEDNRLKYRYLDLRTKRLQDILILRSKTANKVRRFLEDQDFVEIETPVLYKSTPEGARDYIVPSRVHPGHVYALPQSPQTLKQLLMIGGTDKYFQICKCFRDEDLRADRQPEFTQIDIEVSFPTQDYIRNLVQGILKSIFDLPSNFTITQMTYDDAMNTYGSDKPDVRFEMKQFNATNLFAGSSFETFSKVAADKGLIKTMFVSEKEGSFTRKDTDSFTEVVKPHGGRGVAFFKVDEKGEISGGISKFVDATLLKSLYELAGVATGTAGTWMFFADNNHDTVHACADALRRHLGKKLGLIKDGYSFLWVYDFPLLEWSEEDGRYAAKHHPFTMPKRDRLNDFLNADPTDKNGALRTLPAEAYDIVCNGYELGGGSLRIFDQNVQAKMFEVLGLTKEETEKQFGFFIEALKYGTPPHGGLAFGLDRIMMLLCKTDNLRDVIAFPKTTSATDLMSGAPSRPNDNQLKELNFSWTKQS
jgi:aspartyl-tRNA synthetase